MVVRQVWSPVAAKIRCRACGVLNASSAAYIRVPASAPAAPSISAAASPRPSAIPPAASTGVPVPHCCDQVHDFGVEGHCGAYPVTVTTGLLALGYEHVGADPQRTLSLPRSCTWHSNRAPAALIVSANGAGSPKDNITAAGWCGRARSSSRGWRASDQVMNPQPNVRSLGKGELSS